MRLLIILLTALAAAIALGTIFSRDTGMVIFSYAGYNIQTSFSFFLLSTIVLISLAYYLIRAFFLPKAVKRWRRQRRHRRSEKYLTQGLLGMLEGNWKGAEKAFHQGAKYSRLPVVNYLAAARAAQQAGDIKRRDHYLHLAHDDNPDSSLALGLTQAKLQLSQKQTEQAYATLKVLNKENRTEEQVRALLLEATADLNEWSEALELLNDPACRKVLSTEQIKQRQLEVYSGLLAQCGTAADRLKLEQLWENIPTRLRDEVSLIDAYVSARLLFDDTASCEVLLRKALKRQWHARLIQLYGRVSGQHPGKQLQFAEQMLQKHKADPDLLFTLGCLCKRGNLWGKAKGYLMDALEVRQDPQTCEELALLLEGQGEHAAASVYFQKGLALATGREEHHEVQMLESPEEDAETIADGARQVV